MAELSFEPARVHRHPYSPEDLELAKKFAHSLASELKGMIREVVFFGSSARGDATRIYERDIDVLVIVNDATLTLSSELVAAYRIITEKAAAAVSGRFHINTLRISAFWEYALNGDPVSINIIRDGVPMLGSGFIEPFKALLAKGEMKPSKGNVMLYMLRAPQTLMASRWHLLQATIDLYWACLDACHAALIRYGQSPDSPSEAIGLAESIFIKNKLISKEHLNTLKELHAVSQGIVDRSIKDVDGARYSAYEKKARAFVSEMKGIISNS